MLSDTIFILEIFIHILIQLEFTFKNFFLNVNKWKQLCPGVIKREIWSKTVFKNFNHKKVPEIKYSAFLTNKYI